MFGFRCLEVEVPRLNERINIDIIYRKVRTFKIDFVFDTNSKNRKTNIEYRIMNTVQYHIKELLFEQDCVVIPDFGGFVTNFDCAKIDVSNRFITPPQKWLAFNSLLKNDDGLLANYIAQEEQITREQASLKIKSFVEDTKRYINHDNNYQIEGLGIFSQNEENKIQFQPQNRNFYSESFGMENLWLKKTPSIQNELQVVEKPVVVSDTTVQQVFASQDREPTVEIWEEEEQPNFRKKTFSKVLPSNVLPYVYGVVGSALLATTIYLYDNSKANLGSFNPFKSSKSLSPAVVKTVDEFKVEKDLTETKTVTPKAFENEKTVVEPAVTETIISNEKRFFVITGSFGSKKNAKKLLNTLKKKGFEDASIIYPVNNEKLIKVSAGGFNSETQAEQEASKVADAINQATWIYKK
jgi:nucleoid DNA-binding protein/cell division protein FtsN